MVILDFEMLDCIKEILKGGIDEKYI